MTSTRLPGKVMLRVLDRPLLEFVVERVRQVRPGLQIVVATSWNAEDDAIAHLSTNLGVKVARGPEQDVLRRYAEAAEMYAADPVIRITSDCPLLDPDVTRQVLERYERGDCDYAANTLVRTYPRGLDTEVFSAEALATATEEAAQPYQREHVTPFIYQHPDRFRLCNVASDQDLSEYRLTVDTPEDFALIKTVLERLYPEMPSFRTRDILNLLQGDPALRHLNSHVVQKPTEG
jgi:spore coat polysaccharide biosynthesis protein SpsF